MYRSILALAQYTRRVALTEPTSDLIAIDMQKIEVVSHAGGGEGVEQRIESQ